MIYFMSTFETLSNYLEELKNQIDLIFNLLQISLIIILFLVLIGVIGFIRRNLGIDKQSRELVKIRKLLEKKND